MRRDDDRDRKRPEGVTPPAHQEGSVESIGGGRPSGSDADDRTGHGRPPEVTGERPPAPDAFVSEEVDARERERGRGRTRTRS